MNTAAVILAGGQASRMGGGDKCRLLVDGRPIIDRILETLRPQLSTIALNANGDPARFADLPLPILPDSIPDHLGPLAGILAGLDWAASTNIPWLLTVPGDTPFLPLDLLTRLHQARGTARFACAHSGDHTHPTIALWPTDCRADLRHALQTGIRKVRAFATPQLATWSTLPRDPFQNVNTPADLEAATLIAANPQTIGARN